jgi:ADP-ribosyl-[dinitrogen reductase] hydrolase
VVNPLALDGSVPAGVAPSPQQIRAGILAYAARDALGVPWEGKTPDEVPWEVLEELPERGDWPRGATSDDTDQMLLVARYLAKTAGHVQEREFLTRLAKALPRMRGVGPTTSAAVRRFIEVGQTHATDGDSIGAAMRAPPFGWATPATATERGRELTARLSRATHGAPAAIMSACVVATMAAWAIEQHPMEAVVAAGLREADDFAELYGLAPATLQPLRQAADGDWGPYQLGMPLDAVATVASILYVLRDATSLADAMKCAVALGGDTDGYFVGTHTAPLPTPTGEDIPATGKPVRVRACDIATVQNGVITSHRFYFDQMEFLGQLGLLPETPS